MAIQKSLKMDRIFPTALIKLKRKLKDAKIEKKKIRTREQNTKIVYVKPFSYQLTISIDFCWCNKIKVYFFTCGFHRQIAIIMNFVQCESLKLIEPPGNDCN